MQKRIGKTSAVMPLLVAFVILFSACSGIAESADESESSDPFTVNKLIGRGVNLGNALEAPKEGEWGVTLQKEYFDLIKQAGFDSVRLPVRWSAHALEKAPYTIDPNFFKRVDWAVDNSLSRNLPIMVNMHHYNEFFVDPASHKERFLALWKQIAAHYKDRPNTVLFEPLNEPQGTLDADAWNQLVKEVLEVIRQSNPKRTVVIGPANYNSVRGLGTLKLPESDRNIIVSFHYYEPYKFTHQGAQWVNGSEAWLGKKWLGIDRDKRPISKHFKDAAEWGKQHNRPINVGEFGAYEKADMDSRARWTKCVADTAAENGFSMIYWEFCNVFGVYDPVNKVWRQPILKALLPEK